jgi:DNA-binding NarL/FixJ family response regulator
VVPVATTGSETAHPPAGSPLRPHRPGERPASWPDETRAAPSTTPPSPGPGTASATERVLTVLIIDDQPVTRAGLERLVSEHPLLVVGASVSSVDDLAGRPAGTRYDVVVLTLPAQSVGTGVELVSRTAQFGLPIVVSAWGNRPTLLAAMRAGARACLTRHSEPEAVWAALSAVALGGVYVCPRLAAQLHSELLCTQEEPTRLAPREIETLRWIALGFTQSQIATRMGLSQATVNTYAKRIRRKLNVSNKADLTRMAIELGYVINERRHRAA